MVVEVDFQGKAGFEHMRGALPLTAQFDCGLEPADLQKFLMENIGPDCIYQGECKQNTVIEGFWRILHHGCIWIFRLQLYHLQILLLLDIDHQSSKCSSSIYHQSSH
eukprot:101509_1